MPDTQTELTIAQALRDGAAKLGGVSAPLLDARVLLKHATGYDDAGLIANANVILEPAVHRCFASMIMRRADQEPVAYITGVKEFWSLNFNVTSDVLIPREDSECLIEAALERRRPDEALMVLDLGTGSGCLLCALLSEFENSYGVGLDRSLTAVALARQNAHILGLKNRAAFFAGDWLSAFSGKADLIIANPPYIPDDQYSCLSRDISAFEPSDALFAGADGLDSYMKILEAAPAVLSENGLMIIESGDGQSEALMILAAKAFPTARIEKVNDLKGLPRAVIVDLAQ